MRTLTQTLTTATSTNILDTSSDPATKATFAYNVTSIGTDVVLRAESSLDGTSFVNIDSTGADTTVTSNGPDTMFYVGGPVRYFRFTVVSINGGTPSIDIEILAVR